jgi:hypothetical protein
MKKVLSLQIAVSTALLALFYGCSGGGSNNLSPLTPLGSQAGAVNVCGVNQGCGGTGNNSEISSQNYEVTSDKNAEFRKYCMLVSGNAEPCHLFLKGSEAFSVDLPDNVDAINDSLLPILNPGSQNGGLPTGITLFPGDLLTIRMADGHYSTHPSYGHCSNDISVEGNQVIDGQDTVTINTQNGMPAGAYLEFVDASGVRSGFQAVGRTSVNIHVPSSGSQSNPLSILIGFNASALSCGDIKVSYQIKRCLNSALNTFDCSQL